MACWVGNDIVDLAEPAAAGKERDRRFMERVFTAGERAHILAAAAPTVALWKAWAAKEAAYKIAGKIREKVIFAHRAFEVTGEDRDGLVRFEDLRVRVRWEVARDYVHCIAEYVESCFSTPSYVESGFSRIRRPAPRPSTTRRLLTAIADWRQPLGGRLSAAEQASVHSRPSERARLLARRLLEQWDLRGGEVLRAPRPGGWGAPVVARGGRRVEGFDVSLSHDGRFVAAALAGPGTMQNEEC